MQPLKLTMRFFGPYKNETVDFTELTNTPVFLVSGNTGSGKTTIFDAMCYALFGQTTNDQDRDAAALRSDFAPDDQETLVTFTFKHQGQTYQITRKPKQVLQGRGERMVERGTKVSLIYPLESDQPSEISKIGPANDYIESLLNMTRDQFKQIVLLPQGKFRQFLESSSSDKENLLRDLFKTNLYQQWADLLKERLSNHRKSQQATLTKLNAVKEGLEDVDAKLPTVEWQAAVSTLLKKKRAQEQKISREIKNVQERVDQLNQQLNHEQQLIENFAEYQQTKKALTKLDSQKPIIEKLRTTVKQLSWYQGQQKNYLEFCHAQSEQQEQRAKLVAEKQQQIELQAQQKDLQVVAERLEKQESSMKAVQGRANILNNQLPQFEKLSELRIKQKKQQQLVADQQGLVDQQTATVEQIKQEQAVVANQLDQLGNLTEQKLKVEEDRHQLTAVQSNLDEYDHHHEQLTQLQEKIHQIQKEMADSGQTIEETEQRVVDLQDAHARSEIARLVLKLKPGSPCPVCGSTDHPHPATVPSGQQVVSDQEVKAVNDQLTQLKTKQAARKSQLMEWQSQLTQAQTRLHQILMKVSEELGTEFQRITDAKQKFTKLHEALQTTAQQLNEHLHQQTQLQKRQVELEKRLADCQQQLSEAEESLSRAKEQLTKYQAALQTTADNLSGDFQNADEVKHQLSKWQTELDQFGNLQKENQQRLLTVNERLATSRQVISDLEITIQNDDHLLQKLKEQLTTTLNQYSAQLNWDFFGWASDHLAELTNDQERLQKHEAEQTRLETLMSRLAEQIGQRERPDIEKTKVKLEAVQQQLADLQQQRGEIRAASENAAGVLQRVSKIDRQQNEELKRIQDWQTVSDVMNGNTDNKLSLERYVLQSYLNDVLQVANDRLAKLTNGRYAFVLSDDQARGNGTKWSGLEINVYDDNAGQERSVRTLSGGESFIASLALALGLGEVIQERSGGIQVDVLFIDEGFGSLDQEALNQALNALQSIQGYKMIGIISHVTELENQVPNQLRVISQNGVSHVHYQHEISII